MIASAFDLKTLSHAALCFVTAGLLLAGCDGAPDGRAGAANDGPTASLFASFVNRKRAPELPTDAPVLRGAILSHTVSAITVRAMSGDAPTEVPQSVTVRIRSTTAIYLDTTVSEGAAASGAEIQQMVTKVDTLQALDLQSMIGSGGGTEGFALVWGDASTGELVATVIVVLRQQGRPTVVRTIAVDGGGNSGGY